MTDYKPEGIILESYKQASFTRTALFEAMESEAILESRAILCDSSKNLILDLGCMKGVIPREEGAIGIAEGISKDISIISRVNKPVCFVVSGFGNDLDGKEYAILSRRRAQEKCIEDYHSKLVPGDVIKARVTYLETFGCFVDIGCGISSLIPIDSISVSRISHPKDRFFVGQNIIAVVKNRDEQGRISLSHKELLGSWSQNAELFSQGETVAGIIRSVEEYGIFVELTPNLAGLAEPKENVKVGQQASVYIKSLIPEKMKVKLIIVDSFDAEYDIPPPKYFITADHIDYWKYSPENCKKIIESYF